MKGAAQVLLVLVKPWYFELTMEPLDRSLWLLPVPPFDDTGDMTETNPCRQAMFR